MDLTMLSQPTNYDMIQYHFSSTLIANFANLIVTSNHI